MCTHTHTQKVEHIYMYIYVCMYVRVCAHFLWEFRNVGIHVLRSMGGGQRTTSEVGSCPSHFLRWSLVPRHYRWKTRCSFRTSLVSALHLCRGALGFQMFTVISSFTWNLGIWTKVFMPAQEMLCPLSHISPVHVFYIFMGHLLILKFDCGKRIHIIYLSIRNNNEKSKN